VRDSALPLHQNHPRSESIRPSSDIGPSFQKSVSETLAHTSPIPITFVQLSDPSSPVGSKPSPDSLAFNVAGTMHTDIYDSALEMVVVSSGPLASQGKMCHQQISESSPLVPSERQLSSSANQTRDPGYVPTLAWPISPFSNHPPTSASQVTVSPGAPVDLTVFDWNSIPNPLVETTISTSTCRLPCRPDVWELISWV
jgi:hypothetical protein